MTLAYIRPGCAVDWDYLTVGLYGESRVFIRVVHSLEQFPNGSVLSIETDRHGESSTPHAYTSIRDFLMCIERTEIHFIMAFSKDKRPPLLITKSPLSYIIP
jgi:hypothetical protein